MLGPGEGEVCGVCEAGVGEATRGPSRPVNPQGLELWGQVWTHGDTGRLARGLLLQATWRPFSRGARKPQTRGRAWGRREVEGRSGAPGRWASSQAGEGGGASPGLEGVIHRLLGRRVGSGSLNSQER